MGILGSRDSHGHFLASSPVATASLPVAPSSSFLCISWIESQKKMNSRRKKIVSYTDLLIDSEELNGVKSLVDVCMWKRLSHVCGWIHIELLHRRKIYGFSQFMGIRPIMEITKSILRLSVCTNISLWTLYILCCYSHVLFVLLPDGTELKSFSRSIAFVLCLALIWVACLRVRGRGLVTLVAVSLN